MDRAKRNKIRSIVDPGEKILRTMDLGKDYCLVRVENSEGVLYSIILDLVREYEVLSAETKYETDMLIGFIKAKDVRSESPEGEIIILDDADRAKLSDLLFDRINEPFEVGTNTAKISEIVLTEEENKQLTIRLCEEASQVLKRILGEDDE